MRARSSDVKRVVVFSLLLRELSDLILELANAFHLPESFVVLPFDNDGRFLDEEEVSFLEATYSDDTFPFPLDVDDFESGR